MEEGEVSVRDGGICGFDVRWCSGMIGRYVRMIYGSE